MVAEWHCAVYNWKNRMEWRGIQDLKKFRSVWCSTISLGAYSILFSISERAVWTKSKYIHHENQFVVHTKWHLDLWPSRTQHGPHKSGKLIRGDPLAQYGLKKWVKPVQNVKPPTNLASPSFCSTLKQTLNLGNDIMWRTDNTNE